MALYHLNIPFVGEIQLWNMVFQESSIAKTSLCCTDCSAYAQKEFGIVSYQGIY
jgi:hypothetical protein